VGFWVFVCLGFFVFWFLVFFFAALRFELRAIP
jgi:hypothetical protein